MTPPDEIPAFGDDLATRVERRQSQIVLGLDPHPEQLWPTALAAAVEGTPAERTASAVAQQCIELIESAGLACVAAKLQLACFERLGTAGWVALEEVAWRAREAGLLVIADGKRGDIAVSATAYGQAFVGWSETPFGPVPGLGAHAITVNPLLGADAIQPILDAARTRGAGALLLVRTSNPGAADVEDLELADGGPLWERLAVLVDQLGAGARGARSGLSDVGAVVGATAPGHIARMRELMPNAVFLLPGVGAQGGRVEELAPAFAPGRAAGLVSASRSIAQTYVSSGGDPGDAARAEAERLRAEAWELA